MISKATAPPLTFLRPATSCNDGTKVSVRPSGTEPKIKFYIEVRGDMKCPKCYKAVRAEAMKKVDAVRESLGL